MTTIIPTPMTNDNIIALAPAAGSFEPVAKASTRYSFVPTLTVVNALRDVGWFPISAEQSSARHEERFGFQQHMIRLLGKVLPPKARELICCFGILMILAVRLS
jgi:hypothetical protein